jgi:ribosomal protein L17
MARLEIAPEIIIKDGKITNSDILRTYWRRRHHREAITRRAVMQIYREEQVKETYPIPQPVPPKYQALDQIKSMVLNLENKLNAHLINKERAKTNLRKFRERREGIEIE